MYEKNININNIYKRYILKFKSNRLYGGIWWLSVKIYMTIKMSKLFQLREELNLCLEGEGIAVLESPVPRDELIEIYFFFIIYKRF